MFILGKIQYHNVYPSPEVIEPEIIAKRMPYGLVLVESGMNKAIGIISGFGISSYFLALEGVIEFLRSNK